ncbi:MAG: hypothetical protein PUP90_09825 [Nostoc sp. S4]|nr:hypothetical protein [Nostoc sp. S4]
MNTLLFNPLQRDRNPILTRRTRKLSNVQPGAISVRLGERAPFAQESQIKRSL